MTTSQKRAKAMTSEPANMVMPAAKIGASLATFSELNQVGFANCFSLFLRWLKLT